MGPLQLWASSPVGPSQEHRHSPGRTPGRFLSHPSRGIAGTSLVGNRLPGAEETSGPAGRRVPETADRPPAVACGAHRSIIVPHKLPGGNPMSKQMAQPPCFSAGVKPACGLPPHGAMVFPMISWYTANRCPALSNIVRRLLNGGFSGKAIPSIQDRTQHPSTRSPVRAVQATGRC